MVNAHSKRCTVPGCTRNIEARGLCPMHRRRLRVHGDVGSGSPTYGARPIEARLFAKIDKRGPDECWPWTARSQVEGYGYMTVSTGVNALAHRKVFELAHGPIPEGLDVCHHCDNPPCCNPAHLFSGTRTDNVRDSKAKGRHAHGEKHGGAKLTESQVLAIRAANGTQREIAARFHIGQQTVSGIRQRKRWRHVP